MVVAPLFLLIAMLGAQNLGVRLRQRSQLDDKSLEGLSGIDAAIFGLMGLLLAFTFSSAAGRFDERRKLVIKEANDIGTAWLRIDLLAPADQPPMRELFRNYLDSRLESYKSFGNLANFELQLDKSAEIQSRIWGMAVPAAARASNTAGMLFLPALNAMFDTCSERAGVMLIHAPGSIFGLLVVVMLLCQTLAGYRLATKSSWTALHRITFAVILAVTYYVIIDLEYPRFGLIRVDEIDRLLQDLRQSMG